MKKFFTSESVTEGHPDKVCDNISDGLLDAILTVDPNARTAIECAAAVVLMEYAIDHWVLPAALDYVIMAMAAYGIFGSVRLVARRATRNEEVPWKER